MRVLGLALAGMIVLSAHGPVYADPLGPKTTGAGTVPGTIQWRGGSGWHPGSAHIGPPNGKWCPPPWALGNTHARRFLAAPAVPTYWVWGPRGGAFDYPDLLGPTTGWDGP
jgi:hypothetical protein